MTGRKDKSGKAGTALVMSTAVGPGKPPIEYRFQQGRSGNPAGRPRRSGKPGDRLLGATEPTRQMILEEAYRTVEIHDGDTVTALPMNRAVFRAMGIAALNGNPTAQRRWAAMVQETEAVQKRAQLAIYNVIEREARERAAKRREWEETGEEHDPYAEDILIDSRSGSVLIRDMGNED